MGNFIDLYLLPNLLVVDTGCVVSSRHLRCRGKFRDKVNSDRYLISGPKTHVYYNSYKRVLKMKNHILTPLAQLKYFFDKNNNNKLSSTQKINCAQQSDRRVHSLHCTKGWVREGRLGQLRRWEHGADRTYRTWLNTCSRPRVGDGGP